MGLWRTVIVVEMWWTCVLRTVVKRRKASFCVKCPPRTGFKVNRVGGLTNGGKFGDTKEKRPVQLAVQDQTTDKVSRLFEAVSQNKEILTKIANDQLHFHDISRDQQKNVAKLYNRTERVERRVDQQARLMKAFAYRSIDTEARSRRNNIIIWGVTERSTVSIEEHVLGFLEDELELNTSTLVLDRVHRLGPKSGSHGDQKRPIIVRFRDYCDVETVMRRAYKLKGTSFGLDRDYPMEIANARKDLYRSLEAREARADRLKVQIRYPARLYIEGRLVKDVFPEWQRLLKEDRTTCFEDDTCTQQMTSRTQDTQDTPNTSKANNSNNNNNEYKNVTDVDSVTSHSSTESDSDGESVFNIVSNEKSVSKSSTQNTVNTPTKAESNGQTSTRRRKQKNMGLSDRTRGNSSNQSKQT